MHICIYIYIYNPCHSMFERCCTLQVEATSHTEGLKRLATVTSMLHLWRVMPLAKSTLTSDRSDRAQVAAQEHSRAIPGQVWTSHCLRWKYRGRFG